MSAEIPPRIRAGRCWCIGMLRTTSAITTALSPERTRLIVITSITETADPHMKLILTLEWGWHDHRCWIPAPAFSQGNGIDSSSPDSVAPGRIAGAWPVRSRRSTGWGSASRNNRRTSSPAWGRARQHRRARTGHRADRAGDHETHNAHGEQGDADAQGDLPQRLSSLGCRPCLALRPGRVEHRTSSQRLADHRTSALSRRWSRPSPTAGSRRERRRMAGPRIAGRPPCCRARCACRV